MWVSKSVLDTLERERRAANKGHQPRNTTKPKRIYYEEDWVKITQVTRYECKNTELNDNNDVDNNKTEREKKNNNDDELY